MENIFNIIKWISAGVAAVITYLFGGVDTLLMILIALLVIDYLTGVLAAIYNKKLSSEIGFKGIVKKVAMLLIVAVAHMIGQAVSVPELRSLVVGFYIANEAISVLENTGRMGVPFPAKLREVLEQIKQKAE